MLEIITIIAILLSPALAVEAQKRIERAREARGRKLLIYRTLMATRATIIAPLHVEALNQIDIEFNPRKRKEKRVLDAWRVYHDHLCSARDGADPAKLEKWAEKRIDLLTQLLSEMGQHLGYDFDEVLIRKGSYFPTGLGTIEDEQHLIRSQFAKVLSGQVSIPMKVTDFPFEPSNESVEAAVRKVLPELLEGRAEIKSLAAPADKVPNQND